MCLRRRNVLNIVNKANNSNKGTKKATLITFIGVSCLVHQYTYNQIPNLSKERESQKPSDFEFLMLSFPVFKSSWISQNYMYV